MPSNLSRALAGLVAGSGACIGLVLILQLYLLNGPYAFDILSTTHWNSLITHLTAWYDGRVELVTDLITILILSCLVIPIASVAIGFFGATSAFPVVSAPFIMIWKLC